MDEELLWQDKLHLLISSYATDSPAQSQLHGGAPAAAAAAAVREPGWAKLKKSWCGKRNTGAVQWAGVGVDELLISSTDGELQKRWLSI